MLLVVLDNHCVVVDSLVVACVVFGVGDCFMMLLWSRDECSNVLMEVLLKRLSR